MRSLALALALGLATPPLAVPFGAAAGELRDPTRPPSFSGVAARPRPAAARIALEAVWVTPQRRVARINGREVEVGDALFGARVKTIEPTAVTLEKAGESLLLTFTETVIRPAEDPP